MTLKDLTGQRFGRLSVISRGENIERKAGWNCLCDCGKSVHIRSWSLVNNNTRSCGCWSDECRYTNTLKHGAKKTTEYNSWRKMRDRCYRQKDISYHNYGAKGITVCDRWLNSFENFLSDMGKKPSPGHSLDRIKSTGNYELGNCKWSTRVEQNSNKSSNRFVIYGGLNLSLTNWAKRLKIHRSTLTKYVSKKSSSDLEAVSYYVNKSKK